MSPLEFACVYRIDLTLAVYMLLATSRCEVLFSISLWITVNVAEHSHSGMSSFIFFAWILILHRRKSCSWNKSMYPGWWTCLPFLQHRCQDPQTCKNTLAMLYWQSCGFPLTASFFSPCCCQRGRLCLEAAGASFVGRQPSFCAFCPLSGETSPHWIHCLELKCAFCHIWTKNSACRAALHFEHHHLTQFETGVGVWCSGGSSYVMIWFQFTTFMADPQLE